MKHTLVGEGARTSPGPERVASLFRRRAFNVDSLTVGHTEDKECSRMTIVVDTARGAGHDRGGEPAQADPGRRGRGRHAPADGRSDLALIRVRSKPAERAELASLVEIFRARIVDVATDSVIVEVTGDEQKVDGLVELLRPRGILEMVRTGKVAMIRGSLAETKEDAPAAAPAA